MNNIEETYGKKTLNKSRLDAFFNDLKRDLVYAYKYTHDTYIKVLNVLISEYKGFGFTFESLEILYTNGLMYIQSEFPCVYCFENNENLDCETCRGK